jgi:S-DNA-T family DNA segregation ATPase FtsK/SpoIIIE
VPLEKRREPMVIDLTGSDGHLAVVGRPQSGKSTLLRTVVCALSLKATPQEVQFYVLDFGGGSFTGLRHLPHLSGLASRTEPDLVRRTVAEVRSILNAREVFFRTHDIDSMDTYRVRRSRGEVDDGWGDVFLVVDDWMTLRKEFEAEELAVQDIAARGLAYGVHLMVTSARWGDIRMQVKDMIGTRLELRLCDATDSVWGRELADSVPASTPGRGIDPQRMLHAMAAVPRLDGSADPATMADGVADLVARVQAGWAGPAGPKLRVLPEHIDLDQVRVQAPGDSRVLLGVDEASLAPFGIDPTAEQHLYLFGESGSGKSTVLRTFAAEVLRVYAPPRKVKFFVVDYRRALLGQIPSEHVMSYMTSHDMATSGVQDLAGFFRGRLPGAEATAGQLRDRSWWTGAEGFLLVDDYDLVVTSQGNPLLPLVPLLGQAGDLGLHVVIARHMGGASRAVYDPVLQRLGDLSTTAIMLSGNPNEGTVIAKIKPQQTAPGRAQVITRDRGHFIAQIAYTPPHHDQER